MPFACCRSNQLVPAFAGYSECKRFGEAQEAVETSPPVIRARAPRCNTTATQLRSSCGEDLAHIAPLRSIVEAWQGLARQRQGPIHDDVEGGPHDRPRICPSGERVGHQSTETRWWSHIGGALAGIVHQLNHGADTDEGPQGALTVAVSGRPCLAIDARHLMLERMRLLQRTQRLRMVIDFEIGEESQVPAIKHEYRMLTIELDHFHARTRSLISASIR